MLVNSEVINMKRKLINYLCLSGLVAFIFYICHDIIGALYYPGYNYLTQACSDLTAIDSPSYFIANPLSIIYGMFSCLCTTLMCILIQKIDSKLLRIGVYLFAIMNWISAIGYTLFPLSEAGYNGTFQDFMHLYVITVLVVLLSIVSLLFIGIGGLKYDNYKSLGIIALVCLGFMFFGAIGSSLLPKSIFGLIERFSTYSAVVFSAILGVYGFNMKDNLI